MVSVMTGSGTMTTAVRSTGFRVLSALGAVAAAAALPVAAAAGLAHSYALWSPDFGALAWSVAGLAAYTALWAQLPQKPHWGYPATFVLGVVVTVVTLSSPLDTMGETVLLTMHMLEHMALTLVAAVLLVAGTPKPMLRQVRRLPVIGFIVNRFWNLRGMVLYNVVILGWHVPFMYEAALRNESIHDLEHLCFLLFGMLFWGPVIRPIAPKRGRAGAPLRRLLGVFISLTVNTILGSYIFFAQYVLYPTYAAAPRVWDLISVLTDQSIAGGCLWVMGDMAYILAASLLVVAWMHARGDAGANVARLPVGHAAAGSERRSEAS